MKFETVLVFTPSDLPETYKGDFKDLTLQDFNISMRIIVNLNQIEFRWGNSVKVLRTRDHTVGLYELSGAI